MLMLGIMYMYVCIYVIVFKVFAHYEKHRQLILEDIFASLARLPSSKRNLRSYRYDELNIYLNLNYLLL